MIMRIFQVETHPGKEAEFSAFFQNVAIPLMRNTKGIVQVLAGAPHGSAQREFSFVMVWEDLDALKAFVGEDYTNPHIAPEEAKLVQSRTIKHYELVT